MAHVDYMLYEQPRKIAARYGIQYGTLCFHIMRAKNAWRDEREAREEQEIHKIIHSRREDLKKVVHLAAKAIVKVLVRVDQSEDNQSVEDAQKISQILANVHKIYRLERGEPTEIYEKALSTKDIKDIVREINEMDEFADYELVDSQANGNDEPGSGLAN